MQGASLLAVVANDRLRQVLDLITELLPIGLIFNVSKKTDYFDLMIVLDKNSTYALKNMDTLMQPVLLDFSNCNYSLHTFSSLDEQIRQGNLFYNVMCRPQNLLYERKDTALLMPCSSSVFNQSILFYQNVFKKGMDRAVEFLKGAIWYIEQGIFELSTFMLHQATELIYRTFLTILGSSALRSHDLNKLRRYIRRFAPGLLGAFDEDELSEIRLLTLLEKAYCDARYNEFYKISASRAMKLLEGVERLHQRALIVHKEQMFTFNQIS